MIEEKITGKQRVLNHKARHPNDKNERNPNQGVVYAMVKEIKEEEPPVECLTPVDNFLLSSV